MTDPAPGAGDDKTSDEGNAGPSSIAEPPFDAVSAPIGGVAQEDGDEGPETAHDGTSEAPETTEPDNDEEEDEDDDEEDEEDDDDDEDEEPRLKYARLTQNLAGVYKNADATSSFLVAGDKMVCAPRRLLRTMRAQILLTLWYRSSAPITET